MGVHICTILSKTDDTSDIVCMYIFFLWFKNMIQYPVIVPNTITQETRANIQYIYLPKPARWVEKLLSQYLLDN